MDDGTDEALSAETVIRDGGWDPRYARVLLIEPCSDRALVLVDGNGDGAELDLEYWQRHRASGSWHGGDSSGYMGLDSLPPADSWSTEGCVFAIGRADPASVVRVEYGGTTYSRRASELGVWGFAHDADSGRPDDLPRVLDGPRGSG